MYKILIVEDDLIICNALKEHMKTWGYEAEGIKNFNNVLSEFASFNPNLVLLDISLPFYNGFHWCTEIRKISKVPIMFISSASDNMNIVMAMTYGGDDFVSKPFDLNVLTAKIQALLRRSYDFSTQTNLIEHKGVILNISDGTLTYKGEKIDLTKNEFKIIHMLLENRGKAVARDDIMTRLWESDSFIDDNTLTVNVTRIRKKLSDVGLIDFIKTKKGIGYLVD